MRGVNLGNWLVLEKWMGASPLASAKAEDDRDWIDEVPSTTRGALLERHYRTYVTERDFAWLAGQGVELVRIPIPYHLFGTAHHIACVGHLDGAFTWAERYGLKILVDLHTVPLSQNGFDNGGYTALCAWGRNAARVTSTLDLLCKVARRYAGRDALWGIEPLNEPASRRVYLANLPKNRHHLVRVLRSRPLSRRLLVEFYQRFYERVRPVVGKDVKLVFHDQFSLDSWEQFRPGNGDEEVWLDTHQYVAFSDKHLQKKSLAEYLRLTGEMGERVERVARNRPVLVGEWSLANHASKPTREWYRAFAAAQLAAWDKAAGSCFWSLRAEGPGRANWSFTDCIRRGWLNGHWGLSPLAINGQRGQAPMAI